VRGKYEGVWERGGSIGKGGITTVKRRETKNYLVGRISWNVKKGLLPRKGATQEKNLDFEGEGGLLCETETPVGGSGPLGVDAGRAAAESKTTLPKLRSSGQGKADTQ